MTAKVNLGTLAMSGFRNASKSLGQKSLVDILEFAQAPWGLNPPKEDGTDSFRLFPIQKVILKAHYGIPLDDTPSNRFSVTDWTRTKEQWMTEREYLQYLYDNGRCNIREVEPGDERRELVLSLGRRSGKCVTGDTLVLTTSGAIPIRELGDPNGPEYQPMAVGVVQENGVMSDSAFFYNGGVKPTIKFVTRCGYELEGTAGHRVRVMSEDGTIQWRYLDQIQVGDQIAIHRTTNLWPEALVSLSSFHAGCEDPRMMLPSHLTEDWGLLLGYLVGDGCWTKHNTVSVTVEHPETWEELKGLYTRLFGSFHIRMDKRTDNTGSIDFLSCPLREFLHRLGFAWDLTRDTKRIPWSIMRSPRTVVRAFLQGLFETDGCAEKNGVCVSFSTASEQLAREVQLLLLNFGVVSTRRAKWNKKYGRFYHNIYVRGTASRRKFMEEIGFRSAKKNSPVLASLVGNRREGSDAEAIPHQRPWCAALLQSVDCNRGGPWASPGWRRSLLLAALGNTLKPSSREPMTYPRLGPTLAVARSLGADPAVIEHFEAVQTAGYFYDSVVSVAHGEAQVYDLTVPNGESFVAGGMTNHNTALAAVISAYETYKLISKQSPHEYYGLPPTNTIQIISVATDKEQAGLLYQEVSGHFLNSSFFAPYVANNTQSFARFQTPSDIDKYGRYTDNPNAKATLKITFRSCVAKGLRGAGNIVVIMDEMAHFTDKGQSGADSVYGAVVPSTSAYSQKNPRNRQEAIGPVESRIICISSPLGRQGKFFELFQEGMRGSKQAKNMLCIQAPTWEVNPTIPGEEFAKHYYKNPNQFEQEYGASFSDRTKGWIDRKEDLYDCIAPGAHSRTHGLARTSHYVGLDIALAKDGSAIAIGHVDSNTKAVVLDHIEQIRAGEGRYRDMPRLEFEDVADWVQDFSKRFIFQEGMFDTWAGIPFEQALRKRGLRQIKSEQMTRNFVSQMFQNFKDMMWDRRLVLFDEPLEDNHEHCAYIEELCELQAEYHSKYIITVEAPRIEGKHDDMSDALVRMVWLASQAAGNQKYIAPPSIGGIRDPSVLKRTTSPMIRQRQRRLMSGSVESRQTHPMRSGSLSSGRGFKNPLTGRRR